MRGILGYRTPPKFLNLQPGYDYYTKFFRSPGGEMRPLRMAYHGATVFDALKLRTMPVASASLLVDNFVHFNFLEFTPAFLANLKDELPLLLQHARKPFDWSAVPGAAEYDAALARKLKLKESKAAAAATAAAAAAAVAGVAAATANVGVAVVIEASERTVEEVFDWKKDPAERARRLCGFKRSRCEARPCRGRAVVPEGRRARTCQSSVQPRCQI